MTQLKTQNTVLVVDDLEIRHRRFTEILDELVIIKRAWNVLEAQLQITTMMNDHVDFRTGAFITKVVPSAIFLDHDIEHGQDRRDVIEFVKFLCSSERYVKLFKEKDTKFVIHSWNTIGALNMHRVLLDHGLNSKILKFVGRQI